MEQSHVSQLSVVKKLTFGYGANVEVWDPRGTKHVLPMSGLKALSGLAPELALIDGMLATAAEINRLADVSTRIVAVTASGNITLGTNEGKINLLADVGGDTKVELVLPAATGSGARYKFRVGVVNTANYEIRVADAATIFVGSIQGSTDLDDTVIGWECAGTDDTLILNGGTKGGKTIGDWVEFIDILTSKWAVRGQITQADPAATPFSATVS